VTSFADLVPGKFGIPEPRPETPCVAPTEPDLLVVPGVAFDRRGHRVGYGKGYYDRLLAVTGAPVMALAYGFQLVEHIPDEPHDRCMDYILTPEELIRCGDRA
jgi:5-formyltetrahydrofolate cyclo-ligase